jgi:hypothetical protein
MKERARKPRRTPANTPFVRWLLDQMHRANLNQTGLAKTVKRETSTISDWVGGAIPSSRSLATLARTFHVDVRDLYEMLGLVPPGVADLPRDTKRLIKKLQELPDSDLESIEALVDSLLARQEREKARTGDRA